MSTRNDVTYKPLINAGITILVMRFLMVLYSAALTILILLVSDYTVYLILILIQTFLSSTITLLVLIFLFVTFQRLGDRNNARTGKIATLILIIMMSLYIVLYFVLIVLAGMLGVISISLLMAQILLYVLIGVEILNGLFIIIAFAALNRILNDFGKLRDLAILKKFTLIFGIFLALSHIMLATTFILDLFTFSAIVYITALVAVSLVTEILSLCEIIAAIGFIVIGRRLQTSQ